MSKDQLALQLYDKLWTNITQKEARVWTFLSVYGAAIGIAITAGLSNDLLAVSTLVILVLTYWAGELIIDTDWWSIRNRTMIAQIEQEYLGKEQKFIPSFYWGFKFSSSTLYNTSLLVFALLGLLVICYRIVQFGHDRQDGLADAFLVSLTYTSWSVILARWAHLREKRIEEYIDIYKDLTGMREDYDDRRAAQRQDYTLRPVILVAHAIPALLVMQILLNQGNAAEIATFIVAEILGLCCFWYLWRGYRRGSSTGFYLLDKKNEQPDVDKLVTLVMLLLVFAGSFFAFSQVEQDVKRIHYWGSCLPSC